MQEPYCPCAKCQSTRDHAFPIERFGAMPRFAPDAVPMSALESEQRLTPSTTCTQKLKRLSVVVVGGAFAGLMAARTLCRQGVEVTVFEAHEQVGGRVLSDYGKFSKGRITELGAELVGSIHTRWCALAKEYRLGLISRMDGELYHGQQLDEKLTLDKELRGDEIRALEKDKIKRVLLPIAKLASRIKDASRPWDERDPKLLEEWKRYDGMPVSTALINLGVKPGSPLWLAMAFLLVNDNVKPLEKLNFLGLLCLVKGGQFGTILQTKEGVLMGYWDELEIYRCADGCQTLALKIATDIQSSKYRCELVLRRAVTQIDLKKPFDGKPVSVTTKPVLVKPDNTVVYGPPKVQRFDQVIFAIPPSVWAAVVFEPKHFHPKDTVGVMETGDAVKFFSDVEERLWLKTGHAPYGGSLALGQVWEGTDNRTRIGGQGLVLSVFAGGRSPMPNEKDFKRELKKLYRNYPEKARTKFANWPGRPFIKAGLVSPGKNQIFGVGRRLNEPYLGRLFFAGEHTQMGYFGYMEGALRSGERAAELLLQTACGPSSPAPAKPPVLVASAARRREAELPW